MTNHAPPMWNFPIGNANVESPYRSIKRYGTKHPRNKQAFDAYEARQAREAAKADKEYWEDG